MAALAGMGRRLRLAQERVHLGGVPGGPSTPPGDRDARTRPRVAGIARMLSEPAGRREDGEDLRSAGRG